MDIDALKAELTDDPLTRGYSGMTDAEAATSLNAVNREKNKASMTGSEIINALDKTEYLALSDADKDKVWQICHLGTVNPFGVEAEIFIDIFNVPSASITALQAARKDDVSRAVEKDLGFVRVGHVQQARA